MLRRDQFDRGRTGFRVHFQGAVFDVRLVRYYGWYSNKMRDQRDKRAAEEAHAAGNAFGVIDVSKHRPRRIPSAEWRELIKKVWEADPLPCPCCQKEMRVVSLIDDKAVIEVRLKAAGWRQS